MKPVIIPPEKSHSAHGRCKTDAYGMSLARLFHLKVFYADSTGSPDQYRITLKSRLTKTSPEYSEVFLSKICS